MHWMGESRRRKIWRSVGATTVVAGLLAVLPAGAASADQSPPQAAVVSPTLAMMDFGDTVGFGLMCQTGISIVSAAGAQIPGAATSLAPLISRLDQGCNEMSAAGDTFLKSAERGVGPLAALNPAVNPVIEILANGAAQAGTSFADSLGPFAPTMVQSATFIRFFEGG
jgi:hypothetical protein